jgi:hypothetical protein
VEGDAALVGLWVGRREGPCGQRLGLGPEEGREGVAELGVELGGLQVIGVEGGVRIEETR